MGESQDRADLEALLVERTKELHDERQVSERLIRERDAALAALRRIEAKVDQQTAELRRLLRSPLEDAGEVCIPAITDSSLPKLQSLEVSSDGLTTTLTYDKPIPFEPFHPAGRWKSIRTGRIIKSRPWALGVDLEGIRAEDGGGFEYVPPGRLRRAWWRLWHWGEEDSGG